MTPEKPSVILIGGGGHCKACIDVIESTGEHIIAGILDLPENIGRQISEYKILGSDNDIKRLINEGHHFLITLGDIKKTLTRKNLFESVKTQGGSFATIVSATAVVSRKAIIGEGTIVMHAATVNSHAKLGVNNILNTGCCIEHDVEIGDHCHISTHAVINGDCKIGDEVFVGSNAVLVNGVSITDGTIIGAGTVVHKSIGQSGTYAGNPFRSLT